MARRCRSLSPVHRSLFVVCNYTLPGVWRGLVAWRTKSRELDRHVATGGKIRLFYRYCLAMSDIDDDEGDVQLRELLL